MWNGASWGGELRGATVQYWQANWEVKRCRIGRCKYAELTGELARAWVEYWEVNWQVRRCNIGRRIGRPNEAELGAQGLRCGRRIGTCYGAELGGELAGAMGQGWGVCRNG